MEIRNTYVIGSAGQEVVVPLTGGEGYAGLDDASVVVQMEHTFGGSGFCNAVAAAEVNNSLLLSGITSRVRFTAPVGGKDQNRPDRVAVAMAEYLEDMDIIPLLQVHPGEKTEYTVILVSGKNSEGRGALKDAGSDGVPARNRFVLDDIVKNNLDESQFAIVSALKPQAIIEVAAYFKTIHGSYGAHAGKDPAVFALTLNKDTANAVATEDNMQRAICNGLVDMMFFSGKAEGPKMRRMNGLMDEILAHIPLVVETLSEQGCRITFDLEGTRTTMIVPAYPIEHRVNDNGAGEAHHNNFMGVIIAAVNRGLITDLRAIDPVIIETAGRLANLAAATKIQKTHSLWFPRANMTAVGELLAQRLNGVEDIDPAYITECAFNARTI